MPTYQGIEFLERVFDALASQRASFSWEVRVVDSGSTDGTWETLKALENQFAVRMTLSRIDGVEFDHGDTRNLLAANARGEFLVFMTQDAIPATDTWLEQLIRNFEDERVGAVTCRNIPRPDADPVTKVFSAGDPGYRPEREEVELPPDHEYAALNPHERRLLYNFNDVASAFRRELWERHPFPRTPFGEDVLMARAFLEAGHVVVYDAEACVEHSHDYDVEETRSRTRIDGRFNAEWLGRICVASSKDVQVLTERVSSEDAAAIQELGLDPAVEKDAIERARTLRRAAFEGLFEGGRDALLNSRPRTAMRDTGQLRILYVVHGFPPDTWAGTEVYTYNLAKEMLALGHEVAILCRAPESGENPEFGTTEEEFQGLRVFRMMHRLDHASLRESYVKRGPEIAFRKILGSFEPDVVHFQHLIHLSVGLVEIAKARGLATVITCHDYWALCARVQMIRPDGAICPSNMGAGCYLCVKEKALGLVERAAKLGRAGGGPVIETIAKLAKLRHGRAQMDEYKELRERERVVPAAYAAADLRISPSRFLRDKYLESGMFDSHSFLFSDNGMRTDHVEALTDDQSAVRPPDAPVRFGFVGSLVWYKGGEVMVRAVRRLQEAGLGARVQLNVYGSFDPEGDPHHAELERLAQGAPIEFHGRFDNSRLSEVYREIDVLVVPSLWYENSPITIHEAYLTETPVLASNLGGMAEFVRDEVDGLLFGVGDDEDLARQMRRLADEPDLLEKISNADWMEIKTIQENGVEMQARYRALATIVRTQVGDPGPVFEALAGQSDELAGPVETQGPSALLLRPGARARFGLTGVPSGALRVDVDVHFLDGEPDLPLGGTIRIGESAVIEVPRMTAREADPSSSNGATGSRTQTFYVTCGQPPRTMEVEAAPPEDRSPSEPLDFRFTRIALYDASQDAKVHA